MSTFVTLSAMKRDVVGKQVRALRREGKLPGVIYGRGLDPILIILDTHDASRLLPTLSSSQLIVIDLEGQPHNALVRETQRHPVDKHLLHVDFQEVSMAERLRTNVEIVFTGESPAVKTFDGIVVINMEELEIEALPGDLPERIKLDLSTLKNIGDMIRVRDIELSEKVEVLSNLDEIVVVVTAQAIGEDLADQGAVAEPELVEKGKKEEDF